MKKSAIETEAVKQGVDKDFIKYIKDDSNTVQHEINTEGIHIIGAREFVEEFKTRNPKFRE